MTLSPSSRFSRRQRLHHAPRADGVEAGHRLVGQDGAGVLHQARARWRPAAAGRPTGCWPAGRRTPPRPPGAAPPSPRPCPPPATARPAPARSRSGRARPTITLENSVSRPDQVELLEDEADPAAHPADVVGQLARPPAPAGPTASIRPAPGVDQLQPGRASGEGSTCPSPTGRSARPSRPRSTVSETRSSALRAPKVLDTSWAANATSADMDGVVAPAAAPEPLRPFARRPQGSSGRACGERHAAATKSARKLDGVIHRNTTCGTTG